MQISQNLSQALETFGYKQKHEQIKFLENYYYSGALNGGKMPQKIADEEFVTQIKILEAKAKNTESFIEILNYLGQQQRDLIRPKGMERQQIKIAQIDEKIAQKIINNLRDLGFVDELVPQDPKIDLLIILGANQRSVLERFGATKEFIRNKQIKPKNIIFATGARDLWPNDEEITLDLVFSRIKKQNPQITKEEIKGHFDQEIKAVAPENINHARKQIIFKFENDYKIKWPTETDMMKELAKESFLDHEIKIADAPKIKVEDKIERPNTKSSLEKTLEDYADFLTGKIVIVSSQPYGKYQENLAKQILQNENLETLALKMETSDLDKNALYSFLLEAFFASVYAKKQWLFNSAV